MIGKMKIKINREDLETEINSVILDKAEELNKLIITDKNEAYIKLLINRINNCKEYLKAMDSHDFNSTIPIEILNGNNDFLKEQYIQEKALDRQFDNEPTQEHKILEKIVLENWIDKVFYIHSKEEE